MAIPCCCLHGQIQKSALGPPLHSSRGPEQRVHGSHSLKDLALPVAVVGQAAWTEQCCMQSHTLSPAPMPVLWSLMWPSDPVFHQGVTNEF